MEYEHITYEEVMQEQFGSYKPKNKVINMGELVRNEDGTYCAAEAKT